MISFPSFGRSPNQTLFCFMYEKAGRSFVLLPAFSFTFSTQKFLELLQIARLHSPFLSLVATHDEQCRDAHDANV